jgi:hypothetical protein
LGCLGGSFSPSWLLVRSTPERLSGKHLTTDLAMPGALQIRRRALSRVEEILEGRHPPTPRSRI